MKLLTLTVLTSFGILASSQSAFTQIPPAASAQWAGWARCQLEVQGPGYSERQTHTWTITGSAPTIEGAFRVYPGSWNVVGGGSLQRMQGTQTLVAQWAINGAAANATVSVFVRASDGRMFIQSRHGQLRSTGAVGGYQQLTIDGKAQRPAQISSEAFEWAFPIIEVPSNSTVASGSSGPAVSGSVGFMQPAGSRGAASCTWQFGQGASAPASPPILAAVPLPVAPAATSAGPAAQPTPTTTATQTISPTPAAPTMTIAPAPTLSIAPTASPAPAAPTATTTPSRATTTSPTQPSSQIATATNPQATTTSPSSNTASAAPAIVTTTSPTASTTSSAPTSSQGMQAITESAAFNIPGGVTSVTVQLWGGGAGGAGSSTSGEGLGSNYSYTAGVQGHGGGGGAYTRMALAVSQDTTIRVVIGAGGGGGARPFELWSGLKEGVDGSDGSATQLIVDGSVVAEAAGGQANGMGGPKSFSGEVVALAGHDGDAAGPGGAAVAGSITPMATMGGNGGPGPTGTCVLNPLAGVQCDVLSNAGSAGLPGYALISWDIQPGGGP